MNATSDEGLAGSGGRVRSACQNPYSSVGFGISSVVPAGVCSSLSAILLDPFQFGCDRISDPEHAFRRFRRLLCPQYLPVGVSEIVLYEDFRKSNSRSTFSTAFLQSLA
jgi:hypothetical protein